MMIALLVLSVAAAPASPQTASSSPETNTDVQPPAFFAGNDELRGYLLEATERHPNLRAAYEEWLAALEKIPQAKSLEDPMFAYGQFVQSEMNRARLMVSQKLPWFGTRRARREQAAVEAEAALARFYAERNRVFAEVKRAYFEYAFLGESIRIIEGQAKLLEDMQKDAQSRYSLGLGVQADVLRVQMEQTQLQDRYNGLLQYRPALAAQLCSALGRESVDEAPWPQESALPPAPPPAPIVSARIRVANPDLAALDKLIDSSRKQVVLAKRTGFPDITFGIEYASISKPRQVWPDRVMPMTLMALDNLGMTIPQNIAGIANQVDQLAAGQPVTFRQRTSLPISNNLYALNDQFRPASTSNGGEDDVLVSVQMNVPVWRKRVKAAVREAEHMEQAAEHNKRRQALELDAAARMAVFTILDAERRLGVLKDTLTVQAHQIYENLQSAYANLDPDVSFLDVLASIRTLLDFDLERADVVRKLQIGAADLEFLMGGPWTAQEGQQGTGAGKE